MNDTKSLIMPIRAIYGVGLAVWVIAWSLLMGSSLMQRPVLFMGLLFGIAYFTSNMVTAPSESIDDFDHEANHFDALQRTVFYLASSIFALGTILYHLHRTTSRLIVPILLVAFICGPMIILTPAWSIDKKSKSIVYKKHIMSVFMIFSTSLIVTAVLVALSRMDVADVAERLVCIGQISSVCDSKTSTVS